MFIRIKSQFAGFFLCLMLLLQLGCQDPLPKQTQSLTLQNALKAEQQGLSSRALALYQQAAEQGELAAVMAVLRLSEQRWQQWHAWALQLPLNVNEQALVFAELGLWQSLPSQLQQQIQQTLAVPEFAVPDCALQILPVLTTAQSARTWRQFQQKWQQDPQLSTLAVCFQAAVFIDSQVVQCSEGEGRIQCQNSAFAALVQQHQPTQMVVLAGQGGASYNNGIIQLPTQASFELFRHEFSHIFGFMDEYTLSAQVASSVCKSGTMHPNVLLNQDELPKYLQYWQLQRSDVNLAPINTCNKLGIQAFRPVSQDTHMQHFELAMPELYVSLIKKQLSEPQQLMPVAYYFAYLARQRQDWPQWQNMMKLAANFGYPQAQQAVAEFSSTIHSVHGSKDQHPLN